MPETLRSLGALIDRLLDATPAERGALIATLSHGDPARRAELEALVAECEREPALLERPAAERFAPLFDDDDADSFPSSLVSRYAPIRRLGRGGMATVYLARDLKHARDVAVKVVHASLASAMDAERFLREIEIVAQMQHPNIVPLYDSGEADGSLYYVMRHEAGASLRQRLARDARLPIDEALIILRDVCDGLAYAHERGVVHRDIKPDNVLLSGRHAMVADFGIAKPVATATARSAFTTANLVLGTPAYMSPEQIGDAPTVDHRTDIYSVGVLAYEILAGRPPFTPDSHQNVLTAHLIAPPAPINSLRPDVPPALAQVVMTCLEKDPANRWQTANELVQRLETMGIGATRSSWSRRTTVAATAGGLLVVSAIAVALWPRLVAREQPVRVPWSAARIERLTDFPGSEVDASISANGKLVAFLADRDTVFDAFVTQVGSDRFVNLTGGRVPQLFNEDVRNVGFSGDAAHVWVRIADLASPARVSIIPTSGGSLQPFLGTAVMAVWSPDGSKVAYHETTPGDPIFVAASDGANPKRVFINEPGVHSHHLGWSPDGRLLYFVRGIPPDEMDVWRIPATGGVAERVTMHNSRVGYPTLLDDRTLLYTATTPDGAGPWLYALDLDRRVPQRLSTTVEHYTSIATAAAVAGQPRRLVATVSNPSVTLWTVPISGSVVAEAEARRLDVPTAQSAAPRVERDSAILYLASRGGANGLWRLRGADAVELWRPAQGAVMGAAAISPDGQTVCFPIHLQGRSRLECTASDGSGGRALAENLEVRGSPSFSPDGKWLAVAAKEGRKVRVFKIPLDGGAPVRLVDSVSTNPVWSPDGTMILYLGTPRGRIAPLQAVAPDGRPHPLPALAVDRLGDSYRFLPDGKQLVVKLGGFRHQDFWLVDLGTGDRRRLTALRPGESLNRFDVFRDGKRIVFERVRENSDVVLIELPPS